MRVEDIFNESFDLLKKHIPYLSLLRHRCIGSILLITALRFSSVIHHGWKINSRRGDRDRGRLQGFWLFRNKLGNGYCRRDCNNIRSYCFHYPGLILIIRFQYAIPIAISTRSGAIESLKKSYDLGKKNFQFSAILGIMLFVINSIGGIVGVGFLITYPFTVLCFWNATQKLVEKWYAERNHW